MSLRIKIGNGLLPLNLLAIMLVVSITFFPSNVLRIILGIPFVLFFPGYSLVAALFPRNQVISGIQRVALSFGMSIAVVILIGLLLNNTPWGVRLESILYSVTSFILITSIIAWLRRRRLAQGECFGIEFQLAVPGQSGSVWGRVLSSMLIIGILGALGVVGYVIAKPQVGEQFTQFYILGQEGKAVNYPKELVLGEEGKAPVGIVNHERETVSYRIEVRIAEIKNNEVKSILLKDGEKWEQEVSFIPEKAGENQKLEILLYKDGEVEPYLEPLRLWIDVRA